MIINENEKIHIIQFNHKGINLKFQMSTRAEYIDELRERLEAKSIIDEIVQIEFEDSREIERVIECLNVFLREIIYRTTEWRRVCD